MKQRAQGGTDTEDPVCTDKEEVETTENNIGEVAEEIQENPEEEEDAPETAVPVETAKFFLESSRSSEKDNAMTTKPDGIVLGGNDSPAQVDMYRMYNPNSGEHFYTGSYSERDHLALLGWDYEGIGWTSPAVSKEPVFRLYNPNAGDHHYTLSAGERDYLVSVGWNDEGIGWYSDDSRTIAVYRQYNPNAEAGAHNFTQSLGENNYLVSVGGNEEGISWYAMTDLNPVPDHPIMIYRQVDYSSVYDYFYYQNRYADIKAAFGNDDIGTLKHCILHEPFRRLVYCTLGSKSHRKND